MAAQNLWRIHVLRMERERITAKIRGLTNEVKCYQLARDCYTILAKHDEAWKKEA